jgi:hypothetical protein
VSPPSIPPTIKTIVWTYAQPAYNVVFVSLVIVSVSEVVGVYVGSFGVTVGIFVVRGFNVVG